ncbi:HET-domain-containing protein, partial [Microthyrium microscopicum]
NFEQIKSWLTNCDTGHGSRCGSATKPPDLSPTWRFIDCQTRQLVDLPAGSEYFALSYVWGDTSVDEVDATELQSNKLPPRTAQVIEDSIVVVLKLQVRYLWVDKYCIHQWNTDEKHRQIQNMNSIYEGAIATIVAAAGDDASYGLPGVNGKSRKKQPTAELGCVSLISSLPQLPIVLAETKWATRGWTYQEAILSKRCLFFTDYQVYFNCG